MHIDLLEDMIIESVLKFEFGISNLFRTSDLELRVSC